MAEVNKLLETAGLDREVIFAQILADKLDVIKDSRSTGRSAAHKAGAIVDMVTMDIC
jgi:hypothetical protein